MAGAGEPLPLARTALVDDLTRGVIDLIRAESLQEGDRLPATDALAKRFGVATPTMREALGRLAATGAIEIRHGAGTFVKRGLSRLMLANPVRAQLEATTVTELLEARRLIEPELAERAARHRTADDVDQLAELLDAAEGESDIMRRSRLTMRFHVAIAETAGNRVLAQTLETLVEIHAEHQIAIQQLHADPRMDDAEHRGLLTAIRAGHPRVARRRMEQHLEGVLQVVTEKLH